MSPGTSTSQVSSGSRTTRQRSPRRCASARWRAKEPGPVVEAEPRPGGHAHHVGAVVAAIGDEGHAAEPGQLGDVVGEGQVGVRHEHLGRPGRAEPLDAGLDRAVEPASGLGQHHGAVALRPSAPPRRRRTPPPPAAGAAAARTRAAMTRARASRPAASRVGARRALASPNAFTGTSTTQPVRGGRRTGAAVTRPVYGRRPRDRRPGRRVGRMLDKVAVIGAGSWGTTVAAHGGVARPRRCCGRADPALAESLETTHENPDYLPGVALPDALRATASLEEAVAGERPRDHGRALARVPGRAHRARRASSPPAPRCCRWPRGSSRAPTCA